MFEKNVQKGEYMKANTKYSNSGVQYAMYPNPVMNITQSINGVYSHRGTNAVDDAQADTSISNGYAPCDMVCVATDYVNGNAMFWQSQEAVQTVSHGIQYIHMMVLHDDTANAYVGMKIPQGSQLFSEGTAGNATGNHNHIEVALGKYSGTMYTKSGYLTNWGTTVWMMPNNINPSEVFFVDDTNIIDNGGLNWRKIGASSSTSSGFDKSQLIEEQGKATFTVDNVNARVNGPSGTVCRQYNCGDVVNYDYKWIGNGHRYIAWYEASNLILVAVSGSETYGKDKWAECTARDTSSGTDSGSDTNDDTDDIEQPNLADEVLDTTDINLKISLVDKANYARKCPYVMKKPKYIIIHNAGTNGDPSAEQLNKSMNNQEYKSWHFSVDESMAVEGLPLNRNNFSCGDGANGDGNRNGIAIEICRDMSSSDDVANRAEANGALLAAILLKKYGLSVKDGLKKHQDFLMTDGTYKYCPHRILDNGWDEFVAKVESYYNGSDDSDNGSDSDEKVNVGLINQLLELLISILKRIFGK